MKEERKPPGIHSGRESETRGTKNPAEIAPPCNLPKNHNPVHHLIANIPFADSFKLVYHFN